MRERPLLLAVLCGLAAAAIAIAAWQLGALAAPERAALDARFRLRGERHPPGAIVIVALDEETIAQEPHPPPYPRSYYARLIDLLHADGARLIEFDIAFDRPTTPAQDDALRAAARRAAPVLFGTAEIDSAGQTTVLGGPEQQRAAGARVAATLLPSDSDGLLRRVPYAVKGLVSMPVAAAELLGTRVKASAFGGDGALIDYAGPSGSFATLSLSSVLDGAIPAARFAGKVVLVGATARALQDIHATPFGQMAGVEIQANALSSVLAGLPLQPVSGLVTALIVLLLALVAPLAALRMRLVAALATSALATVAYLAICQVAFADGSVYEVSAPVLGWIISLGATLMFGYLAADHERRRLRGEFAAFAPGVVEAVLGGGKAVGLAPTGVIGGYEIEDVIAQGGMAVVYRARQLALDRRVALKLIAPEFAGVASFRERFLRESRLAAAVEHPNVIPVYEAGEDEGLLFIAMRYIDGLDLAAVLKGLGPLAPEEAVRTITQVAGALDAAHAKGLVHRDVKPSNILLEGEPAHVYLTDFGIARAAGEISGVTRAGMFVGTADYAAPEQIEGGEVDGRADIYALGCVLFESLSGSQPFKREDLLATLRAHAEAPPPAIADLRPELAPFDAVIAQALAKLPPERQRTAGELAEQARAALRLIAAG